MVARRIHANDTAERKTATQQKVFQEPDGSPALVGLCAFVRQKQPDAEVTARH